MAAALATAVAPRIARADAVEDWSGDVAILRQAWEAMHPGLTRYSTAARHRGPDHGARLLTGARSPDGSRDRPVAGL